METRKTLCLALGLVTGLLLFAGPTFAACLFTITGTNGNDTLTGGGSSDCIYGLRGNDTISGVGGDDFLYGGNGTGADSYDGTDTLYGGDGNDRIWGECNNDYLDGGAGSDVLDGGLAGDICVFGETYFNCNDTNPLQYECIGSDA